jgi:trehalose-phosphatase
MHTLCLHLGPSTGPSQAAVILGHINAEASALGLAVQMGHGSIEVKTKNLADKGVAAVRILEHEYGPEWSGRVCVVYAGDDTTDEDAFRALKGKALTFRVAKNPHIETLASEVVPDVKSVKHMLTWLAANIKKID